MEAGIYRMVQEAFSNAFKHAQPSYVSLEITYQAQFIKIVVKDNGVGFQADLIESRVKDSTHFGLIGMRERVELLEGRLEIESAINQGTKVMIHIPINAEQRKE